MGKQEGQIALLEAGVGALLERLAPKANFWEQKLPISTAGGWQNRRSFGEKELGELLPNLDLSKLDNNHLTLVAIAWENQFGGGEPPEKITKLVEDIEKKARAGKKLTGLEQTLLTVRRIDPDGF